MEYDMIVISGVNFWLSAVKSIDCLWVYLNIVVW